MTYFGVRDGLNWSVWIESRTPKSCLSRWVGGEPNGPTYYTFFRPDEQALLALIIYFTY
jgi:hypothetical protein